MEAARSVTMITSFAFVGLLLLLTSPVASFSMPHPGDSQCPEEWYRFMNLCWTKVPAGFTLTDHIAGVYCQRLGARFYRADVNSVALCFKGAVRALEDIVPTFTRMFRKRVMGNNGM